MISWLLALLASSQVPYELLALVSFKQGLMITGWVLNSFLGFIT